MGPEKDSVGSAPPLRRLLLTGPKGVNESRVDERNVRFRKTKTMKKSATGRAENRVRRGIFSKAPAYCPNAAKAAIVLAVILSLTHFSCKGSGNAIPAWKEDPIVPGHSAALLFIGDRYGSALLAIGEPDQTREEGKVHSAYYDRLEPSRRHGPAEWSLVVVLRDDGDGTLDGEDVVVSLEVSGDYQGRTPEDLGLGSTGEEIEARLGPCEATSTSLTEEGEELRLLSYPTRGIDFLVSPTKGAVTIIVTPPGGLNPILEESPIPAATDPFGPYGREPVLPGHSMAGITLGEELSSVRQKLGEPGSWGNTGEGLLYLAYTQGHGPWRLALYLEDSDGSGKPSAPDRVVSICVREPYAGKTKGGVGIGSSRSQVISEFGRADQEYRSPHRGEETIFLEYHHRGIVFAINAMSGLVVEMDVTNPVPR